MNIAPDLCHTYNHMTVVFPRNRCKCSWGNMSPNVGVCCQPGLFIVSRRVFDRRGPLVYVLGRVLSFRGVLKFDADYPSWPTFAHAPRVWKVLLARPLNQGGIGIVAL
eukprot:5140615-Pyramimonas_sp.AAC.1